MRRWESAVADHARADSVETSIDEDTNRSTMELADEE